MRSSNRPRALGAAACATLLFTAACTVDEFGSSIVYSSTASSTMNVAMDPRAPSISQQFRVSSKSVQDGGPSTLHEGIDIVARAGTPVLAAAPGRVVRSFTDPAYGNQLVIDHGTDATGRRTLTYYKHLARRIVGNGAQVARGEQIGTMGRTGILAGGISHLHFEVHRDMGLAAARPADPHLFWANGEGRVTCFDPASPVETEVFKTTYPVRCRAG